MDDLTSITGKHKVTDNGNGTYSHTFTPVDILGICSNSLWDLIGQDGVYTVWRCTACGAHTRDNPTISTSLVFGPHRRPQNGR